MNKKNDLLKNTLLLSAGTMMTKVLQFVMIPFFTAWLTVSDYGVFDLLCTYVTLLIPIITLSSGQAMFRFLVDQKKDEEKKIVTSGLFVYILNILIVCLIIMLIKIFKGWSLAVPFIALFVSQTLNDYFQGFVRGVKKLNIYSLCMALSTLFIAIFSTIFIKICNLGLNGIIYGYALGYFIGNIFIFLLTHYWKYFSLKDLSFNTIIKMIKYSYVLIFNDISWWVVNVSDRTIIKFFIGSVANGIYAIANKIPSLCTSVFGMFSISWQQTASEKANDEDRDKFINEVYNRSTATIISLCIGIISCNFIFFDYIFGSDYSLARFHTPILTCSIIFNSISQFLGGIQISFKNPKENGISTVLAAIVNVVVNLSLINFIGLYAASISTLVANVFIVIFREIRLKNKIKLKLDNNVKIYFLIFMYFVIVQYIFYNQIWLSIVNLCFAGLLFIYINKSFFKIILKKFIK